MLTIRKAQIEAMADQQRIQFRKRLFAHLVSVLEANGKPISPEILKTSVERGVAEAPKFGLRSEQHVARWLEIACVELGGFPAGPHPKQAVAILSRYGMEPDRKLKRYLEWALAMKAKHSGG